MTKTFPEAVSAFCQICNWTYVVWLNHKELFDRNPRTAELQKSKGADVLERLSIISQEYSLHQIAKLHDKANTHKDSTLGIDYIIKHGKWRNELKEHLLDLESRLDEFAKKLLLARNKILSHNDLKIILTEPELGSFAEGEDEAYFEELQNFVNIIHSEVIGGPYPFDNLVKNDVAAFMSIIRTDP